MITEPPAAIAIRRLSNEDAQTYRAFVLQALQDTPSAFIVTYDEYRSKSIEWVKERIVSLQQPHDFVLGAFDQASSDLVGIVGLDGLPRIQERHKAHLYGMAVSPSARGRGIGKALVERTLFETASLEGGSASPAHVLGRQCRCGTTLSILRLRGVWARAARHADDGWSVRDQGSHDPAVRQLRVKGAKPEPRYLDRVGFCSA
jgi:GNAT superfamily N-acetyltransferase